MTLEEILEAAKKYGVVDLNVRDTRLEGARPSVTEWLDVTKDTPLSVPIQWVVSKSAQYSGRVRVRLIGHGLSGGSLPEVVPISPLRYEVRYRTTWSKGGWGLQFCKENLTVETISNFSAWLGKVKQIDILGCAFAYITPGREGKPGDGNFLSYRFAQITGAYVRASTADQYYLVNGMDFGQWEGTVTTYAPTGGPGIAPIPD